MQDLTPMAHPHGTFCWFELATSDQAAAKAFYGALFGWQPVDSPMGPGDTYTIFKLDGQDVGAAYTLRQDQRDQNIPPNWTAYVAVDNVDDAAMLAARLGGNVLAQPFDVGEHGRMAVISDPTGAVVALWQANQHAGTSFTGRHDSTICWADLSTPDQERAAAFYTALFGWKMVAGDDLTPATPGDFFHIANGSTLIGGIAPPEHRQPGTPPHWLIYIAVPNCHDTETRVAGLGGTVLSKTFPVGTDGFAAILTDPQGAAFGIHQQG